jgi:peptidoglycan hydrolase CwlO-like protein
LLKDLKTITELRKHIADQEIHYQDVVFRLKEVIKGQNDVVSNLKEKIKEQKDVVSKLKEEIKEQKNVVFKLKEDIKEQKKDCKTSSLLNEDLKNRIRIAIESLEGNNLDQD